MPKTRDRGAARAVAKPSRREPLAGTTTTPTMGAAAVYQTKGARRADENSQTRRDTELLTLLATLKQQHDVIAALEEEGHLLPKGITKASEDQEHRMAIAVVRRAEIVESIIATPASTPAGALLKAEAFALVALMDAFLFEGDTLEELAQSQSKDKQQRLALSLARDVLALGVAV
jgi:hypothetical protein